MNTAGKIAAFAVALAATFGGAWAVGGLVDPINAEPEKTHEQHEKPAHEKSGKGEHGGGHEGMDPEEHANMEDADKGEHADMDH
ncbi:hypothetical protein E0L36_06600 [Streptomyces sp. AJS327]|uniref:hypothetical protein n=1 Tax=Streptomyces sp. AJS327 TaxID=2545265 RepID=UPI0015DD7550|nr:hypothetical protein [Streptomyces sp. AJS327]MBA0050578.1 hypothetical protein [Streptomyces sp. AJS327]